MFWAQLVIGPPGSGKTTYCAGMVEFLRALGRRTVVVNLDPANEEAGTKYTPDIDISELIALEEVMTELNLGPNGGLLYCMEFLETNFDWLANELSRVEKEQRELVVELEAKKGGEEGGQVGGQVISEDKGLYVLFDLPGQVELFTHHGSLKRVLERLSSELGARMVVANVMDSAYCMDGSKFISGLLLSLSTMVSLELPHINVLSKIDLLNSYEDLPFNLDFYTEVLDLSHLLATLPGASIYDHDVGEKGENENDDDDEEDSGWIHRYRPPPGSKAALAEKRFHRLNAAIAEVVEDYALVGYVPLNVQDKESMWRVVKAVDKAGGYVFGSLDGGDAGMLTVSAPVDDYLFETALGLQERYAAADQAARAADDGDGDLPHLPSGLDGDIKERRAI